MSVYKNRARLNLERLEGREVPAVVAIFNAGTLSVVGDNCANHIVVKAAANGTLQVTNNGQKVNIQVQSGTANRSQLTQINVDGKGGDDRLVVEASVDSYDGSGALVNAPSVNLLGGAGNDVLRVNSRGNATLDGGDGNDRLVSGFGNTTALGGAGNDTFVLRSGAYGSWDGGSGCNTAVIMGDASDDTFTLSATDAGHVLVEHTNETVDRLHTDLTNTEHIVVKAGDGSDNVFINDLTGVNSVKTITVYGGNGDDTVSAFGQANAAISMRIYGGAGNDALFGGAGNDFIDGGAGSDVIDGGGGRNVLLAGKGSPTDVNTVSSSGTNDRLVGSSGADFFLIQPTSTGAKIRHFDPTMDSVTNVT
jgi:Ca2+-binding RTX toxin-like protein